MDNNVFRYITAHLYIFIIIRNHSFTRSCIIHTFFKVYNSVVFQCKLCCICYAFCICSIYIHISGYVFKNCRCICNGISPFKKCICRSWCISYKVFPVRYCRSCGILSFYYHVTLYKCCTVIWVIINTEDILYGDCLLCMLCDAIVSKAYIHAYVIRHKLLFCINTVRCIFLYSVCYTTWTVCILIYSINNKTFLIKAFPLDIIKPVCMSGNAYVV